MLHSTSISVVAEGQECAEVAEIGQSLDIECGQEYFWGKAENAVTI